MEEGPRSHYQWEPPGNHKMKGFSSFVRLASVSRSPLSSPYSQSIFLRLCSTSLDTEKPFDRRSRIIDRRSRLGLSVARSEDEIGLERHPDAQGKDKGKKKKKMAIAVAYIGTGYKGLQIIYPSAPDVQPEKSLVHIELFLTKSHRGRS